MRARDHDQGKHVPTHSVLKEALDDGAVHLRLVVHLFHEGGDTLAGELGHCEGRRGSHGRRDGTGA